MDIVSTTELEQAAVWASDRYILNEDGTVAEMLPGEKVINVTVKNVEGDKKNKTKMIFWFANSKALKRSTVAYANNQLLVDGAAFLRKYQKFRSMTFNKGFAADNTTPRK